MVRTDQYLRLLDRMGLKPASRRCAAALGLSVRQAQRIAAGKVPVPRPVALLLIAYAKYGVPPQLWDPDQSREDQLIKALEGFNLSASRQPRIK